MVLIARLAKGLLAIQQFVQLAMVEQVGLLAMVKWVTLLAGVE